MNHEGAGGNCASCHPNCYTCHGPEGGDGGGDGGGGGDVIKPRL
jgi:hypothetical protein